MERFATDAVQLEANLINTRSGECMRNQFVAHRSVYRYIVSISIGDGPVGIGLAPHYARNGIGGEIPGKLSHFGIAEVAGRTLGKVGIGRQSHLKVDLIGKRCRIAGMGGCGNEVVRMVYASAGRGVGCPVNEWIGSGLIPRPGSKRVGKIRGVADDVEIVLYPFGVLLRNIRLNFDLGSGTIQVDARDLGGELGQDILTKVHLIGRSADTTVAIRNNVSYFKVSRKAGGLGSEQKIVRWLR